MVALNNETPVLVVGGGPVGLLTAISLAANGIKCTIIERNATTTKWPKMDLTLQRTVELFRKLDLVDELRQVGVPTDKPLKVLHSTGLSDGGEVITSWDIVSPDKLTEKIASTNAGHMPRQAYQRISCEVIEAFLRRRISKIPLISSYWSMKFESLKETPSGVTSQISDSEGKLLTVASQYVIGCDGGGSRVRRSIGGGVIGGPAPGCLYLIHFKSRDLDKLHRQGQFWHIFFSSGAAIISQDEVETWTLHTSMPIDTDITTLDPYETIYKSIGGSAGPCEVKIDQILVTSMWRPSICIADKYISEGRRVFLAGDSAHQNIPTGGYGMNTGAADAIDIAWKLAAVMKGHAGKELLESYEFERRPVAARNINFSGVHFGNIMRYWTMCQEAGPAKVTAQDAEGHALRSKLRDHLNTNDGENKDWGIEMDYRYTASPVIWPDHSAPEPTWIRRKYTPSTYPGMRAPHVWLKGQDGKKSIYDLLGGVEQFTLVDFSGSGKWVEAFGGVGKEIDVPVKGVWLKGEEHVRSLWERDAVLVRPDDHIAWRVGVDGRLEDVDVKEVLEVVVGRKTAPGWEERLKELKKKKEVNGDKAEGNFSSTVGNVDMDEVEGKSAWQKDV